MNAPAGSAQPSGPAPSGAPQRGGLLALAIDRPVSVLVGVMMVIMFGALSLVGLPIQLTPDVEVPTVTITTNWRGASPTEVEAEILEEQEETLKSLPGLVRMESTASSDSGNIVLEFEVGTSIQECLVRVTNRLSQVKNYPRDVDPPFVSTARASGPPLAVVIVNSNTSTPVGHYRTWFMREVLPRLERIKGVGEVRLIGGQEREVRIEFDPNKLAARKLTVSAVSKVIAGELRDISAGDISIGKRRLVVRTPVAPVKARDLEQVVLKDAGDGSVVRLRDVGTVRLSFRKRTAQVYADGRHSLALLFAREAGSNVLEVTQSIRKTVAELSRTRLAAEGLEMNIVSDQTYYINSALDLVRQNLLLGGVLATVVLLLFLRSFVASMVVSVAIPVCVIGTALGMSLLGRTVNVVSLAGVAFAVGMVVDNAIVVLENIYTKRLVEADMRVASLEGTREVWGAILASTATTAAVFIPVITWKDEVGELLRDVAIALSVAVGVSLVVSVLVIPSFAARLLRKPAASQQSALARFGERFRNTIGRQVSWIVASAPRAFLVSAIAVGGAVYVAIALLPDMEYLPTGNRNIVFGIMIPPPGYSIDEMSRIGRQIQRATVAHTRKEVGGVPAIRRSFFVAMLDQAFMGMVAVDPTRAAKLTPFMRGEQAKVPGVFGIAAQASLFARRIGGGRGVEVDLSGANLTDLVRVGGPMLGAIRAALPGSQVRPIPTLSLGAPELAVVPRRKRLAEVGLTGAELGLVADALVDGTVVGQLARKGKAKLDVILVAKGGGVSSPEALRVAPVATPRGEVVNLGSVAYVREKIGPTVIRRLERRRAITLQVAPPDDVPLETAMKRIRQEVVAKMRAAGRVPEGVRIDLSGTAGQLVGAQDRLAKVLLLAVVICFLLLAALFENLIAPLAVMITIPLAAAGGVAALVLVDRFLGGQTLDMMTAVGFVILIGVVVNNAILVVDGALVRLHEGATPQEAVAYAVMSRVRPIFMSTLTSLAGLLPLVLFPGSGSELYRGVGAIVLGGLALSTALTLYVVPAAFALLWRVRHRRPSPVEGPEIDSDDSHDAPAADPPHDGGNEDSHPRE
ncbi:MAG: efflux RND transporter permease subunit [Myxococcales bacterium]|nr:efflux RND transporter permease subunit [Myxococcales bacterium]